MADPGRRLTPTISDVSDSPTVVGPSSSFSPLRRRPGYERVASNAADIQEHDEGEDIADTFERDASESGLGIGTGTTPKPRGDRRVSIARVPSGAKATGSPHSSVTLESGQPLISPLADTITPYDPSTPYDTPEFESRASHRRSASSLHSSFLDPAFNSSDTVPLRKHATESIRSGKSGRSAYDSDYHPSHGCPSFKQFYQPGVHWLSVCIYILAIFSTVFSGIFLVIALVAPRWGHAIRSTGGMSPGTANVLTQLFAKLIELSFVACFVTFLGQVLSRRAISNATSGVTLAEMNMRSWIMQPGTLITHYETVRYAALTFLGALSLTAALNAMLYTTAAQALVTPQLKFGGWDNHTMYGLVKTSFANPYYIEGNCQSPIKVSTWDPEDSATNVGTTCLSLDHAAQGFYNYKGYLATWAELVASGNSSTDQHLRPQGWGLFLANTTVNGSWIEVIDTEQTSQKFGRIVNNVTLAMPHAGIFQAARDPLTNLVQPEDLDGQGIYNIRAAIPSPYINVLCANMNGDELAPLVYANQSNVTLNFTQDLPTNWISNFNFSGFDNLITPFDDVFGFDENVRPPIFYKMPIPFNTILNNTGIWPQTSIYIIGQGGPDETTGIASDDDFFMCRLKAGLTPKCSTHYTASGSGGSMAAHCEDPNEPMTYNRFNSSRAETTSSDWFNVATSAMNSLSLDNGVVDGDAANARMLTQFQLRSMDGLNAALPSPAEALAVMVGCTLLMSSQDSAFVEFWNYSETTLSPGVHQQFPALIQAQQYASGGTQAYQRGFYVVLLFVFLCNAFVLVYFLVYHGLVTDFSEPPNLFAIAVNSPPSELMRGSCGGGPMMDQYGLRWRVGREGEHLFMAGETPPPYSGPVASGMFKRRVRATQVATNEEEGLELGRAGGQEIAGSRMSAYSGVSQESEVKGSLGRMYTLLSKRRSFL